MKKLGLSCLLLTGACLLAGCGHGTKEVSFEEYKLQVDKLADARAPYWEEMTVKGIWKNNFYWFTTTSSLTTEKLPDKEKEVLGALRYYFDINDTKKVKIPDVTYYVGDGFKLENKKKNASIEYDQFGKFAKYYSLEPNCDISIDYKYAK